MPFNIKNPPKVLIKQIKKRHPDATINEVRQFVHIFNGALKDGDTEEIAFSKAWGILNKNKNLKSSHKKVKSSMNDYIPSGVADQKYLADFVLKEVNNETIAKEIVKNHLAEDPHYYTKMKDFEMELESSSSLVNLAKALHKLGYHTGYEQIKLLQKHSKC